jgi:phosphatidylserine/phosphatidylglycerophosphate/cardiolipin synthase-like enzyme
VDIAQFYITHPDLIDALCFLSSRKQVHIRLLTDSSMSEAAQQPTLNKLTRAGVEIFLIAPPRHGKMHMKCLVVDGHTVITGTANWTQQAFDLNFEDTLVISSHELARRYLDKMDEMAGAEMASEIHYSERQLNPRLTFPIPKPPVMRVPPDRINAPRRHSFTIPMPASYFTPDPTPLDTLANQIHDATSRINVAIYLLNDDRIVTALVDRAQAGGCPIRVLTDVGMEGSGTLSVLQQLATAGIDVRTFGSDRENLHMKTAIIDGRFLWSGSANWTKGGASLNIEDMLCFDAPDLAAHTTRWLDQIATVRKPFSALEPEPHPTAITNDSPAANGWLTGLPPSAPRNDWDNLLQHIDAPPLEKEAYVAYVPDEAYAPVLLDLIRNAHQTILIAMYKVANPGPRAIAGRQGQIIAELEKVAARGVYVSLLLHIPVSPQDALYDGHSQWAEILRKKGIDVRLSLPTLPMHEKFVAVDQCKVLVGSHNWSEGALDGSRVFETSALVLYPHQQPWLADYFFSRPVISDMTDRETWERELTLIRHTARMNDSQRSGFLESFGIETENEP